MPESVLTAEQQAVPSPALDLGERFQALKQSRIRVSAAHTTRASSIGHECERFLFYERTAGELRKPHPWEVQAIFDLGKELERIVVRELEAMGCDIVQRERDYHDRERELTGHADAKIRLHTWDRALPVEIKGLNPYTAETIETLADLRESRQPWVRKYYAQLQLYIHFDDAPAGIFALLNKTSGQIRFLDCPRDDADIALLLAKAERIRDAIRANEPPARHETDDCQKCPFLHVCLPDLAYGPGVRVFDSAEAEALIRRRLEVQADAKEYDEIGKQLGKMLPEDAEVLVGGFVVKGARRERAGFTVKPSSYFERKYLPLVKGNGP